jgi:hypothetical protein
MLRKNTHLFLDFKVSFAGNSYFKSFNLTCYKHMQFFINCRNMQFNLDLFIDANWIAYKGTLFDLQIEKKPFYFATKNKSIQLFSFLHSFKILGS